MAQDGVSMDSSPNSASSVLEVLIRAFDSDHDELQSFHQYSQAKLCPDRSVIALLNQENNQTVVLLDIATSNPNKYDNQNTITANSNINTTNTTTNNTPTTNNNNNSIAWSPFSNSSSNSNYNNSSFDSHGRVSFIEGFKVDNVER